jgi:hypothetical protein
MISEYKYVNFLIDHDHLNIPDLLLKLYIFNKSYFPYGEQNGFRSMLEQWKRQSTRILVMRYFILHTAFMDRKSTLKKQRGR